MGCAKQKEAPVCERPGEDNPLTPKQLLAALMVMMVMVMDNQMDSILSPALKLDDFTSQKKVSASFRS